MSVKENIYMKKIGILVLLFSVQSIIHSQSNIKKILFIGNSYTYVNDLPTMFTNFALSTGDTISTDSSTPGGHTFNNHTQNSTTISKIMQGNWNYVVLQEQSQLPSFPISQVETECFPYAHTLDSLINYYNPCVETVFYMTWGRKNGDASNCSSWPPVCTYNGMDSLLRIRYTQMAVENNAILSPVGVVWNYLRTNYPSIELYSSDESHPSLAGTYAATCSFYASILRKDPTLSTYYGGLDIATAQSIQQASKILVYDSLQNWFIGSYSPNADFTFNLSTLNVSFTNNSTFSESFYWDFGDGLNSNIASPTHDYAVAGTYTVKLFASKCGITDSISKTVTITPQLVENRITKQVLISPIPCNDYIQINGYSDLTTYSIYNIFGQRIQDGVLSINTGDKYILNASSLVSGIYTIRFFDKHNRCVEIQKIIKR